MSLTAAASPTIPRRFWVPTFVFTAVLLLRLITLLHLSDTPDILPTHGDMRFYDAWGKRIAAGQWTDHQAFYGLPGYAYWLGGLYALFGTQPFLPLLLQAVAEGLTAAVIYKLGERLGSVGRREGTDGTVDEISPTGAATGALAAAGWAFCVPAQTFSMVLMPTAYLVLAFWSVVGWVVGRRAEDRPTGMTSYGAAGLAMGAMAMMVANILFLLPLLCVDIWTGGVRRTWPARAAAVGMLAAGVLAGTAPCWVHNRFVAGEPVFLSAHGGINFYMGNNPLANGYPRVPPGMHADQEGLLEDSLGQAQAAAGRPLRRWEASGYWSKQAKAFIREHPAAWAKLLTVKVKNAWNALEYDDLGALTSFRENGITFPGPHFGLIAVFALAGVVALLLAAPGGGRWVAAWVGAAAVLHLASLLTVFVTERYRLAAVPGLLVLGAGGVVAALRAAGARRVRPCAAYLAALAVAAGFVHWPQHDPMLLTHDDFNTGLADLDAGRLDRAQGKLERVFALAPDIAENNFALGNLWLQRGDRVRAKAFYRRTLELDPRHSRVLNNLGLLALEEGRWETAESFLRGALARNPADAKTNYLLARACLGRRDLAGARVSLAEALRLEPQRTDFLALRDQLAAVGLPGEAPEPSISPVATP